MSTGLPEVQRIKSSLAAKKATGLPNLSAIEVDQLKERF
jgi:hypothetical protein